LAQNTCAENPDKHSTGDKPAGNRQDGDFDVLEGDADYDQTLSDWRDGGGGVKMPFHPLITINGTKIFDTTLTEVSLKPGLPADAFTVPDSPARQGGGAGCRRQGGGNGSSGGWATASISTPMLTTRTMAAA
jgi:hypothetical protein